jgi:hypothetical protein
MPGTVLKGQSGHRRAAKTPLNWQAGAVPGSLLQKEVNYPLAFPDPG